MPRPLLIPSLIAAGGIIALGAVACLGVPLPPTPPKAIKSPKAAALAQSAGVPMAIVLPKLTNYVNIRFDVDPNNGGDGYINVPTYLQGSNDEKTWVDIKGAVVTGNTNGAFSIAATNGFQFYRTRWGLGEIR